MYCALFLQDGAVAMLSEPRYLLVATSVGDLVLFAGGSTTTSSKTVISTTPTLKYGQTPPSLQQGPGWLPLQWETWLCSQVELPPQIIMTQLISSTSPVRPGVLKNFLNLARIWQQPQSEI